FVFLSLRLLFSARTAFVGLLLAAFLPMHVYLAQYVTNEMLAATLATATLYACLRLLKSDTPSASQFAWVGFTLGATMLAKATTVLLLPIAIAAIAGKLAYTRARLAISLRNLGLLLTICLTVCGWHYARIWLRFGTPLLGNWDVVSGFTGGRTRVITLRLITFVSAGRWCIHSSAVSPDLLTESIPRFGVTHYAAARRA